MTRHSMRLNPFLRYLVGDTLRTEAERLAGLYITGAGYRRALSAYVHKRRGFAALFLWEVRDYVDRMPGQTVPEVYNNLIAGLQLKAVNVRACESGPGCQPKRPHFEAFILP